LSSSCVPYVASFSGFPFFIAPSVFSNVYCLRLVCPMLPVSLDFHFWLPLRYSLTFIVFVLCVLCCQFLWIVHFVILPSVFSNVYCLRHVYLVLPVSLDCPFFIAPSVFSNVYCLRLVYPMLPDSLDCPFLIAPSVFSNFYCLRLVYPMLSVALDCPLLIAPSVFSHVYCRHFEWKWICVVFFFYCLFISVFLLYPIIKKGCVG
jgi:hypothetical protein